MDEYAALAQRVVLTMDDVRGCLVLSRDGMVLGAYPEEDEQSFKPAWLKFVNVGEARRGFVEFSDQMWAYVHRGPYAAFVVAGTAIRPGVLLDQLEQAVLAAEESRAKKGDTLKVPDAPGAPSGRPRTSLHPADRPQVSPAPAGTAPPPQDRSWARGTSEGSAPPPQPPIAGVGAGGGAPSQPAAEETSGWRRQALAGEQGQRPPVPQAEPPAERPQVERPQVERPPVEAVPAPSAREDVTAAGRPAAFSLDSSPFARLEAESAAAAAEAAAGPAAAVAPPAVAAPQPVAAGPTIPSEPEERQPAMATTSLRREPQRLVSPDRGSDGSQPSEDEDELGEVDRVMLAKEFSGLLQSDEDGDEEIS